MNLSEPVWGHSVMVPVVLNTIVHPKRFGHVQEWSHQRMRHHWAQRRRRTCAVTRSAGSYKVWGSGEWVIEQQNEASFDGMPVVH